MNRLPKTVKSDLIVAAARCRCYGEPVSRTSAKECFRERWNDLQIGNMILGITARIRPGKCSAGASCFAAWCA